MPPTSFHKTQADIAEKEQRLAELEKDRQKIYKAQQQGCCKVVVAKERSD